MRSGLLDASERYKVNLETLIMLARKDISESLWKLNVDAKWIIHPRAAWLNWWNIIILVIMLYSFLFVPYLMAFQDVDNSSPWFIVDVCVDFLFFLDIIITTNTAFYHTGQLIISRKEIMMRYARGMLIIDCVSTFPVYLANMSWGGGGSKSNSLIRFLRITKLSKLCRATKLVKVFKFFKFFSDSQVMDRFFKFSKKHSGLMRLLWTLNLVAIISHFTACMWYFCAKLADFGPDTWVTRNQFENESDFTLYLISLYWAITTLTTVGFGDIIAQTPIEMLIAMLWMLFGVGFYSFVMGSLSSMITSIDEDTAYLEEKLQLVDLFSKDTGLSRKHVKEVVAEVSTTTKGATLNEDQRSEIVSQMSRNLRSVVVKHMHDSAAYRIEILSKINVFSLSKMLPRMVRKQYQPQETIYTNGDPATYVYFLLEGRVRFVLASRKTVFKTVVSGGFFGEAEVLQNSNREYLCEAEGECDVLLLRKDIFLEQLNLFPDFDQIVRNIASVRKIRNEEKINEALDLIETVEIRRKASYKELAGKKKILIQRMKSQLNFDQKDDTIEGVGSEGYLLNAVTAIRSEISVPTNQEIDAMLRAMLDL